MTFTIKAVIFMSPRSLIGGHIVFALSICTLFGWFVCWLVGLSATLTLLITFDSLMPDTSYLAYLCNSWSLTFSYVAYQGQGHVSRSKVRN